MTPIAAAADRAVISDAQLNETLELGETIEARTDGDLDADGDIDTVYVLQADLRTLHVLLRDDVAALRYTPAGVLVLEPDPRAPARVSIAGGILVVKDRCGGDATMTSTRRYRLMPDGRMRLIGLDAALDPGRPEIDGFSLSWNLLTGSIVTHVQRTVDDAPARTTMFEQRAERRSPPILMEDTPDPEMLMIELRGR